MTIVELAARLQAVVGDSYRVVRELGGGGMSRVFLAEETRLSRQVVIKLLPPEMGAAVNVERFEREIQLAARLQHPHIVPLLTAGASGDLLYYIMPFIAGESLRVRLASQGELPIPEAVRVLREVGDALAYAHANGVVHRDIKPDNVLLSAGHAVVTDFGVAKAVSASSGGGHLTSLGLALGTPAYMAPEQAAADPHVDHRADIYALGALAYEMLCGRTPFLANSPQALLAAHITQAPETAAGLRASISPALNAIVMRCLEKRPADRWQSAGEFVAQLDSAATPSAGLSPSGAQTIISGVNKPALRLGHPAKVGGIFAGAALLVLLLVWVLVERLGLPDWVWYGAVGLVVIGLPIVLMTSVQERRRALARTAGVARTTPPGSPVHLLTWRKALVGGGMAFGGLALIAGGYSAMRLLGIGPVGTLVAAGVIKDRQQIVLADFENRAADSTLGPSVTEAFRVDLSQSPTVRVMDQQAIAQALTRMQRPVDGALSASLAREMAEREGITAIVTGQIDPVGQGFVLAASLVSAADGKTLSAVRETAESQGDLLKAIDRLSGKLRERIGESLTTIRANPALDQVTTASLPALRKYTEALRLEDADRTEDAIPLLQDAVALDSGFAMAWRKLAVMLVNTGGASSLSSAAATRAFQHRDRLPELERDLAVGYYYYYVEDDPAKVIAAYRSALTLNPDDLPALNNLAVAYSDQHSWADAESLLVRASRLGHNQAFFSNLMQAQVAQGRMAEAQKTLARFDSLAPQSPSVLLLHGWIAMATRDYPASERAFTSLEDGQRSSPYWSELAIGMVARLKEREGKLSDARSEYGDLVRRAETRGDVSEALDRTIALAAFDLRYGGSATPPLARIDSALKRHPLSSIDSLDRPYLTLVYTYARGGRVAEARRLLQGSLGLGTQFHGGKRMRLAARGALAEAEGSDQSAIDAYLEWNREDGVCVVCGLYEAATVYDRMGRADSAIAYFESAVNTPNVAGRIFNESYTLAPSYKRLGELYEARGDRNRASEYYGRFVALWKDADPVLQPTVKDVRTRLARLAQESGT
jgi:eukaryotic-like serine/threonine-protein kinase